MNHRYIHKAWQVGDNVQWDDLAYDHYGVRCHGQITKIWRCLGVAWVSEDNGYNHSIEMFRLMDPEFP